MEFIVISILNYLNMWTFHLVSLILLIEKAKRRVSQKLWKHLWIVFQDIRSKSFNEILIFNILFIVEL